MSLSDSRDMAGRRSELVSKSIDKASMQDLKNKLRGMVLSPDDEGFESARKVFNGAINKVPLLIVQCAGVADVINAVNFARSSHLLVAIRGNGHNVAGNAVCDGGIVIDLSHMKGVRVAPKARTARAEPGVTWKDFDHETQVHGLATTGGTISSTGISGLTLGGGMGWLLGKYGLTCDNLLSADVVTANGQFVTASASSNPDLFWALRGGGGNFGVVTSFKYRVHPVGPVLGGTVIYPFDKAIQVLQFYRSLTGTAPDELTANASLLTISDGTPVVTIDLCYVGSIPEGEKILKPLREFGPPLKDLIRSMPYCHLQSMFDHFFRAGQQSYWKSSYMKELTDEAIDTIISYFKKVPSKKTMLFIEHFHGAARRVAENVTAFGHRDVAYSLLIASNWSHYVHADSNKGWTQAFFAEMQQFSNRKVYVNYLGEDSQEQLKEAYGTVKYEQLVTLKNKYDPTNFFSLNQNIKPTIERYKA